MCCAVFKFLEMCIFDIKFTYYDDKRVAQNDYIGFFSSVF